MNLEFEFIDRGSNNFPVGLFEQSNYLGEAHHHIEYEIFYLEDGRAVFGVDGREQNIYPGDFGFIEPGTEHYCRSVEQGEIYHYIAMVFDISVLGGTESPCRKFFERVRLKRYLSVPNEIAIKLKKATEMARNQEEGREIIIKAVLFGLLSHVIVTRQYERVSLIDNRTDYNVYAIDAALLYIRQHYSENICLGDLLALTNYSKSHFIRLFKEKTGTNFIDYINKYRIEKSCLDLIYSDKNITEIASENGFNNIQYFSRIFKEYMKCTPKEYQRDGKGLIVPSSVTEIK